MLRLNPEVLFYHLNMLEVSTIGKGGGAYAVSARSCGRSSPVSLAFEPVVEKSLTPGHGASMKSGFPQFTFPRLP